MVPDTRSWYELYDQDLVCTPTRFLPETSTGFSKRAIV
jgi:hypothetical protein